MTNSSDQDVAFIQALAAILKESDLSEIEVKRGGEETTELKVRLSKLAPQVSYVPAPAPAPTPAAAPAAEPGGAPAAAAANQPDLSNAVTSPMVGTVYLSPEPGAPAFVSPGDEVTEGQTILIIEAMKTMNQIPAPRAGRVRTIIVDNGEPVEFGEPLMIIE